MVLYSNRFTKKIYLSHLLRNLVVAVFVIITILLSRLAWGDFALRINTLSSIGERNRSWFLFFSAGLSITLIAHMSFVVKKLNFKSKKTKTITCAYLFLNYPLAILQAVVIEPHQRAVHMTLAIIFTAYSILTVFVFCGLIIKNNFRHKSCKQKLKQVLAIVLIVVPMFVTGIINLHRVIAVYGFLIAYYQLILIYSCIISTSFLSMLSYSRQPCTNIVK